MALLVPNVGEEEMLKRIIGDVSGGDVTLHLYGDNITPTETDTVSSYTELTGGNGYSKKVLDGTWTISGDPTGASYPEYEFSFNSGTGETVYGYFVTDSTDTVLLWAERFSDAPYTIPTGGGSIFITPKIQLD